MARMDPLPVDASPELASTFATFERILGIAPRDFGERVLSVGRWTGGKHVHDG